MSLFDEFVRIANATPYAFPAKPESSLAFADLFWDAPPTIEEMTADPGMTARTKHRQLAFHRIHGEIRYYLGMAPEFYDRRSEELGVVKCAEDAVTLGREFLLGCIPGEIEIPRVAQRPVTPWREDRSWDTDALRPKLDTLTHGRAEPIDVPGAGIRPWVRAYLYRDVPSVGLMTVFSLGASSGSWPTWVVERPELVMTVRSLDASWALGLVSVIQHHAHRSEFRLGEVLDLGRPLAATSTMQAIRIETPAVYSAKDLRMDLADRTVAYLQAYPLYREELFLGYDARPLPAKCGELGADPVSISRAALPYPREGDMTANEWELQYLLARIDELWIRLLTHSISARIAEEEAWETWGRMTSPALLNELRRRQMRVTQMNPLAAGLHTAALMEAESRTRRADGEIRAGRAEVLQAVRELTLGDGYPDRPIL